MALYFAGTSGAAMASPNHAWWEGLYVVGRNFYARFLPQVREVAGEAAAAMIERHLGDAAGHQWLKAPNRGSPILGVGHREGGNG